MISYTYTKYKCLLYAHEFIHYMSYQQFGTRHYSEELKASKLTPAKIWNLDELLPEAELGEKFLIHFKL